MDQLPVHLQKYIVDQDYNRYTAEDQAVWRYVLRQLRYFLSKNAHESYIDGLKNTGIHSESIPKISEISSHLEKFGWRALPVSGFIPPAAFMELQSLGVLPIASDMRSIQHLLYTPAPDIVHEAAGHAPIIADAEYSAYLKQYAQVAKKAIISKEDLNLYQAIRELSDVKENPASSAEEIRRAEEKLISANTKMSFTSEASQLSRMNWWTAEYGLVGSMTAPKIFGAGLLSSVGESRWCLSDRVKKIPLSIDCIAQSYDITEPQPQLFVARDFKHLCEVLNELSELMAYKIGGKLGLDRAIQAESVNTVEFENGLQISGVLSQYILDHHNDIAYLQFTGPTQLCFRNQQIEGHGTSYHSQGYGTPVGSINDVDVHDLALNQKYSLNFKSGVKINGTLTKKAVLTSDAFILTFKDATSEYDDKILFRPEWGLYDVLCVQNVKSVFGGAADRVLFGETDDFVAARVALNQHSLLKKSLFQCYQQIRDLRFQENLKSSDLESLYKKFHNEFSSEWLIFLELYEISVKNNLGINTQNLLKNHLLQLQKEHPELLQLIDDGFLLVSENFQ